VADAQVRGSRAAQELASRSHREKVNLQTEESTFADLHEFERTVNVIRDVGVEDRCKRRFGHYLPTDEMRTLLYFRQGRTLAIAKLSTR